MNIPSKIDSIISERKKMLPKINEMLKRVEKAKNAVKRLEDYQSNQSELQPELKERLSAISTKPFYEKLEIAEQQLKQLQQRFSRKEIHICFVGKARQGKSLVLQRISGLESDVIPSSDGSHCTGARSIIFNNPDAETKAEIKFYTEREYVDIVNAYLKTIFKGEVTPVSSADGIGRLDLEQLQKKITYAEDVLFDLLKKYVEHIDEFRDKFGLSFTVPKEQIESYVAQYSSKDHEKSYYTYLGVKQAKIYAPFPYTQCGRIVLVDTIGAGDTALGIEEDMTAAVQESDVIILVLCPDAKAEIVYKDESELMTMIANAVTPEYTEKMLFWLMNRRETADYNNARRIPVVIEQLKKRNYPVAQYLNVNCSSSDEVERELLVPVLEQMSRNLTSIDRMIITRANEQMKQLEQAFHSISSKVERAMGASINGDERRVFLPRIRDTIMRTTNELRNLYFKLDKEKDLPCETLKEAAADKLRNVVRSVPSQETIMQRLNDGRIMKHDVLESLASELRIQIINDFLELNDALHDIVAKMKHDVVQVLAGPEYGRLGFIVNNDSSKPDVWLKALRNKLDEKQFPLLCDALEPLENFDLRMENFLIYKVRCCLKPIDWSINDQPPQLIADESDKVGLMNEIDSHLRHFLEDVHQGIADELADFYVFPNTALFAVLRDFFDRIICRRSENGELVETEWRYLYEDKIPMIWAEEHKSYVAAAGRAEEWRIITEEICACAADGYFWIDLGEEHQ